MAAQPMAISANPLSHALGYGACIIVEIHHQVFSLLGHIAEQ